MFQSETTSSQKVHRFCVLLLRTNHDAFDVLISALKKDNQEHVAGELQRIEKEGSVHSSSAITFSLTEINNKKSNG